MEVPDGGLEGDLDELLRVAAVVAREAVEARLLVVGGLADGGDGLLGGGNFRGLLLFGAAASDDERHHHGDQDDGTDRNYGDLFLLGIHVLFNKIVGF